MIEQMIPALIGGLLIGLAAAIYLLGNGRIMGMSGILAGLLQPKPANAWRERIYFTIGVVLAPLGYSLIFKRPEIEITDNIILLVIAGILVGFGTRMGSGCTSGHGVCGMGRFSRRSTIAVVIFMLAAIVTVYFQEHVFGGL